MHDLTIRAVTDEDLDGLAALDQFIWSTLGTPVLSRDDLAAWHAERSPYFLLAEDADGICAYTFSHTIGFSYTEDGIRAFLDPSRITGKGMSDHPHDPRSLSVYGITVSSRRKGVGPALSAARHALLAKHEAPYYIGFSRIPGFARFVERVREENEGERTRPLDELALWYAHENARLLRMRTWELARPKPTLALDPLEEPDSVLAFHARYSRYGILDIQRGYMQDPASLGYGVCIMSGRPHR